MFRILGDFIGDKSFLNGHNKNKYYETTYPVPAYIGLYFTCL